MSDVRWKDVLFYASCALLLGWGLGVRTAINTLKADHVVCHRAFASGDTVSVVALRPTCKRWLPNAEQATP